MFHHHLVAISDNHDDDGGGGGDSSSGKKGDERIFDQSRIKRESCTFLLHNFNGNGIAIVADTNIFRVISFFIAGVSYTHFHLE